VRDKINEVHGKIAKDFVVKILITLKEPELIKNSAESAKAATEQVENPAGSVVPAQEAPATKDQLESPAQQAAEEHLDEKSEQKIELEPSQKKDQKKSNAKTESKKSKSQKQKS